MTEAEAGELRGLEVLVAKGKILPSSPAWKRYLELLEKRGEVAETAGEEVTGEDLVLVRDEGRGRVFGNIDEAAAFYAVSRRAYCYWLKIGTEAGDPLPAERPEEMPGWFARMRAAGLRRNKTPEQVLQRAREAMMPPVPQVMEAPAVVSAEVEPGEEATADEISSHYRRALKLWTRRYEEALVRGDQVGSRDAQAQIDSLMDKSRAWEAAKVNTMKASEEYLHRDDVRRTFVECLSKLWQAIAKELSYDPQSTDRMNALAERLPGMLPEVLGTG